MKPWSIILLFLFCCLMPLQGNEGNVRVMISTNLGNMTAEIYLKKAPITGKNFLTYVDHHLYDGTTFFRTVTMNNQPKSPVKIEVIQGGFITGKRTFAPIAHETTAKTGIKHINGAISMARAKPGTAASSFFICVGDQPELDFGGKRNPDGQGFAAFGKIIKGLDVVRKIHQQPVDGQRLLHPVQIISIRRIE